VTQPTRDEELAFGGRRDAEADLVRRAKAMEAAAWSEIYSSHRRFIDRYVRARIFDATAAEDVTADVFLRALYGIGAYRHRGQPLLAWMYGVARHAVADHQRRRSGGRALSGRLLPRAWGHSSQALPSQQLENVAAGYSDPAQDVERLDLRRAIQGLPETQREVVILRHFVGLATPEIAAAIRKQPAAVYSIEARALVSLRRKMAVVEEVSSMTDENRSSRAISRVMESTDTP
jgi:RNA polymerase sigma-70 factor, ECF subfamily